MCVLHYLEHVPGSHWFYEGAKSSTLNRCVMYQLHETGWQVESLTYRCMTKYGVALCNVSTFDGYCIDRLTFWHIASSSWFQGILRGLDLPNCTQYQWHVAYITCRPVTWCTRPTHCLIYSLPFHNSIYQPVNLSPTQSLCWHITQYIPYLSMFQYVDLTCLQGWHIFIYVPTLPYAYAHVDLIEEVPKAQIRPHPCVQT